MREAGISCRELSGIAATAGPGLLGGLIVGLTMGKGVAIAANLPFMAINHLEAHALTPRLLGPCPFPYLLLLISGGHTQFQLVKGVGDYLRLGTTIDDALGEAFDKVAKLVGLGYPGGPQVEARAQNGNAARFVFPRPLKGRPNCDFSFSGLKTAVREAVNQVAALRDQDINDICASFESAVAETLADRLQHAFAKFNENCPATSHPLLVVAGGVAANRKVRAAIDRSCSTSGFRLIVPPPHLCTDNGAMIAWAGAERLALGLTDPIDFAPRARWPLDATSAPAYGSGKSGAKA
jgi:N6-L-threonylcarbamoyladenine synthase